MTITLLYDSFRNYFDSFVCFVCFFHSSPQENGQLSERQATEHFDRLFETLQERKAEMLQSIEQSRNRRLEQLRGQVGSRVPTGGGGPGNTGKFVNLL